MSRYTRSTHNWPRDVHLDIEHDEKAVQTWSRTCASLWHRTDSTPAVYQHVLILNFVMSPTTHRLPRILALDGGGVRGLSSLLILRELMERLAVKEGLREPIRPCERFDLIIGTGMGGISALFLGRMRMTVDEAIREFSWLAEMAFTPSSGKLRGRFHGSKISGNTLEHAIINITEKFVDDWNSPLEDPSGQLPRCYTAVLAATRAYLDAPPYIFRSYKTQLPASHLAIVEVAGALASTAGLSPPVSLGSPPIEFMNAGLAGYNNPAEVACEEISRIFPKSKIGCLVSLGTGLQDIAQSSRLILESCEQVHNRISAKQLREDSPYFRFSVDRGLNGIGATEGKEAGPSGRLAAITGGYLRCSDVELRLDLCVKELNENKMSVGPRTSNRTGDGIGRFLPLLNPVPEIFHGRQEDVRNAVLTLSLDKPAHLAILGPGGIGKTSIARTIIHHHQISAKFGEHLRFVSCESMASVSSLEDSLCTAFQLHNPTADPRTDLTDLIAFLKNSYNEIPLLLILDNFETLWDSHKAESEDLLQILGTVPMLYLVVTMRGSSRPGGLRWTQSCVVDRFSPEAARATFVDISGCKTPESRELMVLLDAVDHVPLAVTLIAHLGQTETPKRILEMWNTGRTSILSRCSDRLNSVDVSIRLSVESPQMRRLPEALLLLQVVTFLPAGVFEGDLGNVCPGISNRDAAAVILIQAALAYYDRMRTLRVLSPIREYVKKYYPFPEHLLRDLQSFHFRVASQGRVQPGDAGYRDVVDTLSRAEPNIEAVLQGMLSMSMTQAQYARRVIRAALNWSYFLLWTRPRTDIVQIAVDLAKKTSGHPKLAECLYCLGETQRLLGDHPIARITLMRARSEFRKRARYAFKTVDERRGAAWCLWSLGEIRRVDGEYEAARGTLTAARAEFSATKDQNEANMCLWNLAEIQRATYDYEGARRTLSTARAEFEAAGSKRGLVKCQWSLAEIYRLLHEYGKAQALFVEVRKDCKDIGDQLWAAWCLQRLGNIQRKLRDYEKAQNSLEESRNEFQSAGNRRGVAECDGSLGELCRLSGQPQAAEKLFAQALKEHTLLRNRSGAAWCLRGLGEIQTQLGRYTTALGTLAQARDEFKITHNRRGMARCLLGLGDTYRLLGDYGKARVALAEALIECRAAGDQYKQAGCLLLYGYVSRDESKLTDVRMFFEHAKDKFLMLGSWTLVEQEQCQDKARPSCAIW